jgi:hypothetical protein
MSIAQFLSHDGALREIRCALGTVAKTIELSRRSPPAQAVHLLRQVATLQAGLSAVIDGMERVTYGADERALGEVLHYARRNPGVGFDDIVAAVGHGPRDTGRYTDAAPWVTPYH